MDTPTTRPDPIAIDLRRAPAYDPPVEFVERKGAGHPDTLCDALAEGLARDLARSSLERDGALRHFNVDKALLSAGEVRLGDHRTPFGGGEVVRPSRIVLAGKVDATEGLPALAPLTRSAYGRLQAILPWATLPGDYAIELWLQPSSADLLPLLSRGARADGRAPLANDTSFAVVSLPRSPLEAAVHAVERALAADAHAGRLPLGADVKVMGLRRGDDVEVTVAAAVLTRAVPDLAAYRAVKDAVHDRVRSTVQGVFAHAGRRLGRLEVHVNRADLEPDGAYLTLTGSSAEAGDDGQVGRGNRVGGLITPHRSMSLEAACGKNPAGHVGKLYHALAWDAAEALLTLPGVGGATVRLLSRIGTPVDRPVAVEVEVRPAHDAAAAGPGAAPVDDDAIRAAVRAALADWHGASRRLIDGRYELV
jgi:S-adenosylmethionine synthetase